MITNCGSCAQYGMVARKRIRKGEKLASIPRTAILSVASKQVERLAQRLVASGLLPSSNPKAASESAAQSGNIWIPLLITLMSEYCYPSSHWRPYFELCPDFDELDPVLLWESLETGRLLKGTGVVERVRHEAELIERDYVDVVQPFLAAQKDLFDLSAASLTVYKKMVSFVMAYSFTDAHCRNAFASVMMVPVADILNHHSRHNARITYQRTALDIVAIRRIDANEEVFNSYGRLGNAELLYKYGFAEHVPNPSDHATVEVKTLRDVAKVQLNSDEKHFDEFWSLCCQLLDVDSDDSFVVNLDGEPEDALLAAAHVLCLPEKVVKQTPSITVPSSLDGLTPNAKRLLKGLCLSSLSQYETSLEDDVDLLQNGVCSRREQFSLFVRIGQKQSLHNLIKNVQ